MKPAPRRLVGSEYNEKSKDIEYQEHSEPVGCHPGRPILDFILTEYFSTSGICWFLATLKRF